MPPIKFDEVLIKFGNYMSYKDGLWSKIEREKAAAALNFLKLLKFGIGRVENILAIFADEYKKELADELLYLSIGFYYLAFRFTKLFKDLAGYDVTHFKGVYKTRNFLFEHMKKNKDYLMVPSPFFTIGWSAVEGPCFAPIEIGAGDTTIPNFNKYYHHGLYRDAREFIDVLGKRLDHELGSKTK